MKTLILATPRSGSHAFSSTFENDLSECMNIEDMLLPRHGDNQIDFEACSLEFLDALERRQWPLAWQHRPTLNGHRVIRYTDQMQKIYSDTQPGLEEFLVEHHRRWQLIREMPTWTVKLIQYQGVPEYIIDQMIAEADRTHALLRRDIIKQAVSLTVASRNQSWHDKQVNAGKLDVQAFRDCAGSLLENIRWVQSFGIEPTYYEDLDLSTSSTLKIKTAVDYDRNELQAILHDEMTTNEFFSDYINNKDWSVLSDVWQNKSYFQYLVGHNSPYWETHKFAFDLAELETRSKNTRILDIGTWFGIMPYVLQQRGFERVECTECAEHSVGIEFDELYKHFDIAPYELNIQPQQPFELPKKYDVIFVLRSNVFWKTKEVLHHVNGSPVTNDTWQVTDGKGDVHTFFTVYRKKDWEFFIENIRKYLREGGVAIVQPSPYCYDTIDFLKPEWEYLQPYCVQGPNTEEANPNGTAWYLRIEK